MRILYVEDNLTNLSLVQRLARIGNHHVINHADGETALANFDRDKPDLVLMDVQLKGILNGLDVVKELRARGIKTPIIAVTAYAMLGDRERCLEAGCDAYLAKPLPIEQLVALFERYDPKPATISDAKPADLVQPATPNGTSAVVKSPANSEMPAQAAATPIAQSTPEVAPETLKPATSEPITVSEASVDTKPLVVASNIPAQGTAPSEPAPSDGVKSEAAPQASVDTKPLVATESVISDSPADKPKTEAAPEMSVDAKRLAATEPAVNADPSDKSNSEAAPEVANPPSDTASEGIAPGNNSNNS
jgi:two-component system cell cycle response regulator DivK